MSIVIEAQGHFPRKPFRPLAAKAWNEFFKIAPPTADLAHWNIHADSGVVRLTARDSACDESDFDWLTPVPICIDVQGIVEWLDQATTSEEEAEVRKRFQDWTVLGILAAFQSASVARKLERFHPAGKSFAIVTAPLDLG